MITVLVIPNSTASSVDAGAIMKEETREMKVNEATMKTATHIWGSFK